MDTEWFQLYSRYEHDVQGIKFFSISKHLLVALR